MAWIFRPMSAVGSPIFRTESTRNFFAAKMPGRRRTFPPSPSSFCPRASCGKKASWIWCALSRRSANPASSAASRLPAAPTLPAPGDLPPQFLDDAGRVGAAGKRDAALDAGLAERRDSAHQIQLAFFPHDARGQKDDGLGGKVRRRPGIFAAKKFRVDSVRKIGEPTADIGRKIQAIDARYSVGEHGMLANGEMQEPIV